MGLFYETAQILIKIVKTTKTQFIVLQCVINNYFIHCAVYRSYWNVDTTLVKGQKTVPLEFRNP